MTNRLLLIPRHMFRNISLILAVIATPAFAQTHDGTWTVTRKGSGCKPKSPITVKIKDGEFSGSYFGGTGRHRIKGEMGGNGSFEFTAKSPRDRVIFQGDIATGTGTWKAKRCKGTLMIFQQ